MSAFSTPMMKQYASIKKKYPDCLLFYRMGDFYELFLEDAHIGAQVLNITLTSKAGGKDGRIPMAGIPYHAVDSYLSKLVKTGYKVAICEQVSLPNKNGLVDREVVRIVTPGTVLDEKALEKKENNYVVAIDVSNSILAISYADISTGLFGTYEVEYDDLGQTVKDELSKLNAAECILTEELYNDPEFLKILKGERGLNIFPFSLWNSYASDAATFLKKQFEIATLEVFALDEMSLSTATAAALLGYLVETQKTPVAHIKKITKVESQDYMILDRSTMINLELFSTIREHDIRGSLLAVLDHTITPMGGRMLKTWMKKPLVKKEQIDLRHDAVDELLQNRAHRETLESLLKQIPDVERILSRLSVNIGNTRDMINLKLALESILKVKEELLRHYKPDPSMSFLRLRPSKLSEVGRQESRKTNNPIHDAGNQSELLNQIAHQIPSQLNDIINLISTNIKEEPPIDVRNGGMIQNGVNKELDKLRKIVGGSRDWILELERQEREKTGITTLKIKFNKVFGFYIEVSKSHLEKVPKSYMRKQTLVNGERFITEELKHHEHIILTAEERIKTLEYELFLEVLQQILSFVTAIQESASAIGIVDCLLNFAVLSEKNNYVRPTLLYSGEIRISQGRHPVVEKLLETSQFVPNDVTLDTISQQLLLITGPNMAGKSVFIRQVALLVFMAQIGCFVPAKKAHLTLVDRIFVRSGASDVITSGLSTFMVEMVETAHILHHATKNSLIVMDEIGRGTSTYDGISIAWAVAEYIVTNFKQPPKTLFATHYHELQALEEQYPKKIKNYHMAVADDKGTPIFLHTILPGGASHSFGVAVAKLAGVPEEVITKAEEILKNLEKRNQNIENIMEQTSVNPAKSVPESDRRAGIHAVQSTINYEPSTVDIADRLIHKELETLDISTITPLQALNKLADLKEKIKLVNRDKTLQAD